MEPLLQYNFKILSTNTKKTNDDEFSEWDEDTKTNEEKSKYWFTRDKMDKIIKVHNYLDPCLK